MIDTPDDPKQVNYVKSATVAFWDTYLKENKQAAAYLASDLLPRLSRDNVKLTTRL